MTRWGVRSSRSAADIAAAIAAGKSSAAEEAVAAIAHAQEIQPKTHAYITIDEEAALEMARAADQEIAAGRLSGPLAGVPISIKDTESTKGIRTTFGSLQYADHVPVADGLLAARLRKAGAVFFAKNNTPSFAHKDMTDNLLGPACCHPMDSALTPGGSSGGAAVSVALGVEPVSQGSDGAGSVRIPAALCGIIGFKPSSGVIPVPELEDVWETKVHNGLLSQRVEDIAVGMSALAGPDPRDPVSAGDVGDWMDFRDEDHFRGKRVLYAPLLFKGNLDADVKLALDEAVRKLESLGAIVDIIEPPYEDPGGWFDHAIIFRRRKSIAHMSEHPDLYDPSLRRLVAKSAAMSLDDFLRGSDQRTALYRNLLNLTDGYDLLVTSSIPTRPWKIDGTPPGYPGSGLADPAFRWPELYAFNMTGWPAISVPCGFTADGFPVGIQFVGKWRSDMTVLRAAWAYLEGQSSYDHLLRFEQSR